MAKWSIASPVALFQVVIPQGLAGLMERHVQDMKMSAVEGARS